MSTGACGINCDVCKLSLMGICSTCGHGKSLDAMRKLETQKRILGNPCPILACANLQKVQYCPRDCSLFPCGNFESGPYPFSQGFLMMQKRRRSERPAALTPNGTRLEVPSEYWERVQQRDVQTLCNLTLGTAGPSGRMVLQSLRDNILIDRESRCIKQLRDGEWQCIDDPQLELISLLYLIKVQSMHPIGKDIVGVQDLKEAHYFKGPHALNLGPLLERYGNDISDFRRAAEYLNGKPVEMADAAYMLLPFPRVPLYYLLWEGDEEFRPKVSVLFDRLIEQIFSASGIWILVNMVSGALLRGPQSSQ